MPEKRFEITISEQVSDLFLTGVLASTPNTTVLLEPLSDGGTKITVEGVTFAETLDHIKYQLEGALANARVEGLLEASEDEA